MFKVKERFGSTHNSADHPPPDVVSGKQRVASSEDPPSSDRVLHETFFNTGSNNDTDNASGNSNGNFSGNSNGNVSGKANIVMLTTINRGKRRWNWKFI